MNRDQIAQYIVENYYDRRIIVAKFPCKLPVRTFKEKMDCDFVVRDIIENIVSRIEWPVLFMLACEEPGKQRVWVYVHRYMTAHLNPLEWIDEVVEITGKPESYDNNLYPGQTIASCPIPDISKLDEALKIAYQHADENLPPIDSNMYQVKLI